MKLIRNTNYRSNYQNPITFGKSGNMLSSPGHMESCDKLNYGSAFLCTRSVSIRPGLKTDMFAGRLDACLFV